MISLHSESSAALYEVVMLFPYVVKIGFEYACTDPKFAKTQRMV